jgi:hypothetical protein
MLSLLGLLVGLGAPDSLPRNGYVVTTIRSACRESCSAAHPGVAAMITTRRRKTRPHGTIRH